MKSLLYATVALALPLVAFGQDTKVPAPMPMPQKNVLSTYMVRAKPGKESELRAALAAHAAKFHKDDYRWRVAEVQSGPNEGMFLITEGPTSWTVIDDRGDLGVEHTQDYTTNVMPLVAANTPNTFHVYMDDLATVGATQYSNKALLVHMVVKPGRGDDAVAEQKKWKAIYQKLGLNVGVWHQVFSGANEYTAVWRMKNGLKDIDEKFSLHKTCDELYGPAEWSRMQKANADIYSDIWTELIEFKPTTPST